MIFCLQYDSKIWNQGLRRDSNCIAEAIKDAPAATGTTIDHKIRIQREHMRSKPSMISIHEHESSESSDEGSDSEALLPGEEEVKDTDDEAVYEDDSDAELDEDSEQEEEIVNNPGKKVQKKPKAPSGPSGKYFDSTPKETKFSATSFGDLNLSRPLVRACSSLGYTKPTPIQAACIPLALSGRDICGSAITGSGKTGAFSLPLLERLLHRDKRISATYVLILVPARELAVQVHSMIEKLAQFTDVRAALVVGGLSLAAQAAALRSAPEIVVGTPVSQCPEV